MTAAPPIGPLSGVKVVDLTTNIAGPLAARLLAEMGADAIHIEPPWGDDGRNSTTPFLGREGTLYSTCNRSKRGVVIDIKHPEGQEVLRRILADADVFIEATVPGSLEALGLGYEELSKVNPRLVQVSVTGWGVQGPLANEPGYAVLAAAYSGAVRPPQREDEVPELKGGGPDPTAALLGTIGALSGLRKRDLTGKGSLVTTSIFHAAMHLVGSFRVVAEDDDTPPSAPRGDGIAGLGGLGAFETADNKWIYISAWNDRQFKRLCEIADLAYLGESPEYATRLQRSIHGAEVNELLGHWVSTRPLDELVAQLAHEKIPASPMRMSVEELFDDPQVIGNEMYRPVEHPTKGTLWQLRGMLEVDGDYGRMDPAPLFGEHTDEVLAEAGFSGEEVTALREAGAVA